MTNVLPVLTLFVCISLVSMMFLGIDYRDDTRLIHLHANSDGYYVGACLIYLCANIEVLLIGT